MTAFRFAVASCQYPMGLLDRGPAYRAYRDLGALIGQRDSCPPIELVLLVGDQVYVDATAGLFDPTTLADKFERPYRVLNGESDVSDLGQRFGEIYCMLDDHEIEDNWEPIRTGDGSIDNGNLSAGVEAYKRWQRQHGPLRQAPFGDSKDPLWFTLVRGRVHFFVADTRTERTPRRAHNVSTARIMSKAQFRSLCEWLRSRDESDAKVVACPSIVLPRRRCATGHPANALRSDAWDGYRRSLHGLLAFIAKEKIRNVLFVSGDEHLSCLAHIVLRCQGSNDAVVVHSLHSSGLYAPYPFANSVPEDLVGRDQFEFSDLQNKSELYECGVWTNFPAKGDGFAAAVLNEGPVGRWALEVEFHGEYGAMAYQCTLA